MLYRDMWLLKRGSHFPHGTRLKIARFISVSFGIFFFADSLMERKFRAEKSKRKKLLLGRGGNHGQWEEARPLAEFRRPKQPPEKSHKVGTAKEADQHNNDYGPPDANPSEHALHPWLLVESEALSYSSADGKWLMFYSKTLIDGKWQTARRAYLNGELGGVSSIRVSTAMPSDRVGEEHVIAFCCGPADDESTVMQIGRNLVAAFPPDSGAIYFKSDEQSLQQRLSLEKTVDTSFGYTRKVKRSLYKLSVDVGHATQKNKKGLMNSQHKNGSSEPAPFLGRTTRTSKTASQESEYAGLGNVMVLDTETTGFPPGAPPSDLRAWNRCRMVEIAWHVYANGGQVLGKQQHIVKPDGNIYFSPGSVKIHGITREKAETEGRLILDVLQYLEDDLNDVSVIVGHNIKFDVKVILAEIHRQEKWMLYSRFERIPKVCTMEMARRVMPNGRNAKLAVVYEECFGEPPDGILHRADADVHICAQVYFRLHNYEQDQAETTFDGVDENVRGEEGGNGTLDRIKYVEKRDESVFLSDWMKFGLVAAVVLFMAIFYMVS